MFDQILRDDVGGCEPLALSLISAAMYAETGLSTEKIASGLSLLARNLPSFSGSPPDLACNLSGLSSDFPGFEDDRPAEDVILSLNQNDDYPKISHTRLSGRQYSTRVLPSSAFQAMATSILASCLQLIYPLWAAEEASRADSSGGRSSSPGGLPSIRVTLTPKKCKIYSLMRLTLAPSSARHCEIFEGSSALIAIVSPPQDLWPNTPLTDAQASFALPPTRLIQEVQPPSVCEWRARLNLPNIPVDLSVSQPLSCYFDSRTRWRMQTGAITQTVTLERRLLPDLLHRCDRCAMTGQAIILALETTVAVDYSGKILSSTFITTLHSQAQ